MAYLAVEKDGTEYIFETCPSRYERLGIWICEEGSYFELPKGSIKKLIGQDMVYINEPIEIVD